MRTQTHPCPLTTKPASPSPPSHQSLPRDFARLVLECISAVEVIWVEKAAIHVGTTAYCSCEERTVDATRLLVVVYVRIENLFVKFEGGRWVQVWTGKEASRVSGCV